MANDIPKEIIEAATEAFDKTGVTRGGYHMCVDIIARAIMAERERCGKYATDQAEREPYGHCKATAYLIADSIMGGK